MSINEYTDKEGTVYIDIDLIYMIYISYYIYSWYTLLLSHVQFSVTPWTAAHQAPLSFTISQSLLKFMSIESVMLSNHFNPSHHQGLSQWVWSSHQVAKLLELQFQLQISSSNEYSWEVLPFRRTWENLEGIVLSEISQILYHLTYMWNLKTDKKSKKRKPKNIKKLLFLSICLIEAIC